MNRVLITGVYGQDGSYMAELLFHKGYEVFGISNPSPSKNSLNNKKILKNNGIIVQELNGDIYDYSSIKGIIKDIKPNMIFHLSALHVSSEGSGNAEYINEQEVYNRNVEATSNILLSAYENKGDIRVLTAGSCLMFDDSDSSIQNESIPYKSDSLYGLAKIAENQLVKYYRKRGLFACTAIMYNHESSRRGIQFVTQKIVKNCIDIKRGQIDTFDIGDITHVKDWSHAIDMAKGMFLILNSPNPDDYILASGKGYTIREFIEGVAGRLGIDDWEKRIICGKTQINRKIRGRLIGDPAKAQKQLGWKTSMGLYDIIDEMITNCNI